MAHPPSDGAGDLPGVSVSDLETHLCDLVQQLHPVAPDGPTGACATTEGVRQPCQPFCKPFYEVE